MNPYSTAAELTRSVQGIVDIGPGQFRVLDEQRLRSEAIDSLISSAVFGGDEVKAAARWVIWEAGQQLGVSPSSILDLYKARGRGDVGGFTVPAMNLRALTYDVSRAAIRAAIRQRVGAFIFEIARSEMGYTDQRPEEYATVLVAAALREGYRGPLFIQGDHFQINRKRWEQDAAKEIEGVKTLIREAVPAGFFNIDLDSSTVVDLTQSTVEEQQRNNYTIAAQLTGFLRSLQPPGVRISVGGEIGEVGGKNSTAEELIAFMEGYLRELPPGNEGISKISIQTGTSHGGVVLPDGRVADIALDFEVLRSLSKLARERYKLAGAVQHGASTLPEEAFHKFVEVDCCEVHLATAFQNLLLESPHFPDDLRQEMYGYLHEQFAAEKTPGQSDQQFIYKTRKNLFGPFKRKLWDLPADIKAALCREQEEKFAFYYEQLSVTDTRDLVDRWVKPVRVERTRPASFEASKENSFL